MTMFFYIVAEVLAFATTAVSAYTTPSLALSDLSVDKPPDPTVDSLVGRQWSTPVSRPQIFDEDGNEIDVDEAADNGDDSLPPDLQVIDVDGNRIDIGALSNEIPGLRLFDGDGNEIDLEETGDNETIPPGAYVVDAEGNAMDLRQFAGVTDQPDTTNPPPAPAYDYMGGFDGNFFGESCGDNPEFDDNPLPKWSDCAAAAEEWAEGSDPWHSGADGRQYEDFGSCMTVLHPDPDMMGVTGWGIDGETLEDGFKDLADSCQAGDRPQQYVSRYAMKTIREVGTLSIYAIWDEDDWTGDEVG